MKNLYADSNTQCIGATMNLGKVLAPGHSGDSRPPAPRVARGPGLHPHEVRLVQLVSPPPPCMGTQLGEWHNLVGLSHSMNLESPIKVV